MSCAGGRDGRVTRILNRRHVAPDTPSSQPSAGFAARYDAFISYARRDAPAAQELRAALADRGLRVWIDVEGIVPGEDWLARIMRAIEACTGFVFLVSPSSIASDTCLQELDQAIALRSATQVAASWASVSRTRGDWGIRGLVGERGGARGRGIVLARANLAEAPVQDRVDRDEDHSVRNRACYRYLAMGVT